MTIARVIKLSFLPILLKCYDFRVDDATNIFATASAFEAKKRCKYVAVNDPTRYTASPGYVDLCRIP